MLKYFLIPIFCFPHFKTKVKPNLELNPQENRNEENQNLANHLSNLHRKIESLEKNLGKEVSSLEDHKRDSQLSFDIYLAQECQASLNGKIENLNKLRKKITQILDKNDSEGFGDGLQKDLRKLIKNSRKSIYKQDKYFLEQETQIFSEINEILNSLDSFLPKKQSKLEHLKAKLKL